MTIERIRQAHTAKPFRPFSLALADGRQIRVRSPEFMFVPPKAERTIVVSEGEHDMHIIDLLLVASLDYVNGRAKHR